jgi:hypothetical protein
MFVSDNININIRNKGKIQTTATVVSAVFLALLLLSPVSKAVEKQSLGQPASAAEIKGWDIDIRPDGKGLPTGRGDAVVGEGMFIKSVRSILTSQLKLSVVIGRTQRLSSIIFAEQCHLVTLRA